MKAFTLFSAALTAALASAADIFVSPSGSDSAAGSISAPLKSIQVAVNKAVPGDSILLRAGTYAPTTNIQITKSGTSSKPYIISAYGSEKVIIDGENLPGTPAPVGGSLANPQRGIFHIEKANYWKIYKLTFTNGPYGVYVRDSSNNYFESIVTHDNYETGFHLEGALSNNQVVYLDSYRNRDPRKNGESADGFALKQGSGTGNILRGARLWENVDDGLDLWEFKGPVTIVDTIAWGNGVNRWGFTPFEGDGNGFKLGGLPSGSTGNGDHTVTNCIAFQNAAKGFTDNKQTGKMTLTRNTAWKNGQVGFQTTESTTTLTNNVAANNNGATAKASQTSLKNHKSSGNSWDGSATWNDAAFVSTSTALVKGARLASGKIASSDFLLPKSGANQGASTIWS